MAFLTPEELQTHLYKENIETIAREDDAIVAAAIEAAIEEASRSRCISSRNVRTDGSADTALAYMEISGSRISRVTSCPLSSICCSPSAS